MSDFNNAVELAMKPYLLNHLDKLKENIRAYGYLEHLEGYIKTSLSKEFNDEISKMVDIIAPMLPLKKYGDKNTLTEIHKIFTSHRETKEFGNAIVITLIHASNKKLNLYKLN